ncbi:MAG TPA: MBL fold metallo-hydrolase [Thermoplasmata archaeon]|nr:MBL fold metallo-hydrolase [Thermoplasmata archaeon]
MAEGDGAAEQMVRITAYGGVNEIGGNKILLEDGDTRIFLDFGEPFGMTEKYFVEWLKPRDRFGLRDYFHFDMIPKIKGLYDAEWLADTDMKYAPPEFDAIFLSHMHFDHAWHVKFADQKIPVYLGLAANTIRSSWEDTGATVDFGEHDYRTFRTGSKVKVGSLEIEPIHVDHSVPGSYGFLVHTTEGCVVYTGDLRAHGPRADMTREFVAKAAKEKPIAMICEGTRVSDSDRREDLSEKGVEDRAKKLLATHKKLAVVSFYPKDVDRMRTFRDVARATGRNFVVSAKVAHLLESLKGDRNINVPDPMKDPNMLVYVRTGMYRPPAFEVDYMEKLGTDDHVVDSRYVTSHQNQLIYHTDFTQLAELIDVNPSPGSLFVRSMSEPHEEDDVQEEILMNWISSFKMDFHQAHASGHANMDEIFSMVKAIAPGIVIPVHTEHATLFGRCSPNVRCPEPRKTINLR